LRRDATELEQRLWRALRELPVDNRFRRQHPVGPYVVDFACPARKLAIELDGGQHTERQSADAMRTVELARRGYQGSAFWHGDVIENLPGGLEAIQRELDIG
jgi:very-short-patch-repair endonuclease